MENSADTSSAQREIDKNYRWNFAVNTLDGASFGFGMSFMSNAIILPLFVSHFTDSPLLIGLIPLLTTAGFLVPQIFVANAVERAPRKKVFPVNLGFFLQRMPIFLLAPMTYFLALSRPDLALIGFFALYAWFTVGTGLAVVGWQDLVAKIIPVEKRGFFLGISSFLGNGAGILGALAVPIILEQNAFPIGYVIAFAIAAVMVLLSWIFLGLTREPAVQSTKPPVSQLDYMRRLPGILRKDRNFRLYLIAQIVFALSGMSAGFLAVYASKTWAMSDAVASGYTVILQVGLAVTNLFLGYLADRRGHKLSLEIALALNVLSIALAIAAPNPWWFFAVFLLRGAVNAGTFMSGVSIVYEFTDAENRATYIGLANTVPGIAGAVAPLIGGWLAGAINYQTMFILSAVIGAASWALMHFAVREPRRPAAQPASFDTLATN